MSGLKQLNRPRNIPTASHTPFHDTASMETEPVSAKRVAPVGDHWITPNNCKMATMSLYVPSELLRRIQSESWGSINKAPPAFETLCAIIWRCIARVREDAGAEIVTVCKSDPLKPITPSPLGNNQVIAKVEAGSSVANAELKELASLLVDGSVDERAKIAAAVGKERGVADFCVYGAKLTFVDLGEADLYGLELNGQKPEFVYCSIHGVGDEGAVLVLPCRDGGEGRLVSLTLPEDELGKLKAELKESGLLHETDVGL